MFKRIANALVLGSGVITSVFLLLLTFDAPAGAAGL